MKAIFYLHLKQEDAIEKNILNAPEAKFSTTGMWKDPGIVPPRFFESSQDLFKDNTKASKIFSRLQDWIIFRLLIKGKDTYDLIEKVAHKLENIGRPITDMERSGIKPHAMPEAVWVAYNESKNRLILLGTLESKVWKDTETFLANHIFKNSTLHDNHVKFDEQHLKMDPFFRQLQGLGYDLQDVSSRDEKDQEIKAKAQKTLQKSKKNRPLIADVEEDNWSAIKVQENTGKVRINLTKSDRYYLQIEFPRFEDSIVITECEKIVTIILNVREKSSISTKLSF